MSTLEPGYKTNLARSISFCRSVGFRRLGTSEYFAWFTLRGNWPAWSAEEDFDPVEGGAPVGEVADTNGVPTTVLPQDKTSNI
jgi:hypothetical protein